MQFLNAAVSLDTTESEPLPRMSELKRQRPIIGLLHLNPRIIHTRRLTGIRPPKCGKTLPHFLRLHIKASIWTGFVSKVVGVTVLRRVLAIATTKSNMGRFRNGGVGGDGRLWVPPEARTPQATWV